MKVVGEERAAGQDDDKIGGAHTAAGQGGGEVGGGGPEDGDEVDEQGIEWVEWLSQEQEQQPQEGVSPASPPCVEGLVDGAEDAGAGGDGGFVGGLPPVVAADVAAVGTPQSNSRPDPTDGLESPPGRLARMRPSLEAGITWEVIAGYILEEGVHPFHFSGQRQEQLIQMDQRLGQEVQMFASGLVASARLLEAGRGLVGSTGGQAYRRPRGRALVPPALAGGLLCSPPAPAEPALLPNRSPSAELIRSGVALALAPSPPLPGIRPPLTGSNSGRQVAAAACHGPSFPRWPRRVTAR
ncbi:hypothetical protein CYMTET_16300 [Cymbomonas tetramitiformis]|uniref:Uncharacterized protein n=1 Tax=Cymbomonas tetramitiformis TaxID=36881 RepID=A0AAE0GCT8_9CHLO|nr:hypothetical protein CYMTET_16300 [Cymbomonas tetramitiformis]